MGISLKIVRWRSELHGVELQTDGEQIHLVEVNPQYAGGFIPIMIRAANGLPLIEAKLYRELPENFKLNNDYRYRIGHLMAVAFDHDTTIAAVDHAMSHGSHGFAEG